jgi:hypothetical protein
MTSPNRKARKSWRNDAIEPNDAKRFIRDEIRPIVAHRVAMAEKLVSTGEAAEAIGVGRVTLARWWKRGAVEPQLVTPGGHARWDIDALRNQLRANRDQID